MLLYYLFIKNTDIYANVNSPNRCGLRMWKMQSLFILFNSFAIQYTVDKVNLLFVGILQSVRFHLIHISALVFANRLKMIKENIPIFEKRLT